MKTSLRSWLFMAGVLVALLGVVGALVLVSGIVPLTASSGHWGITRWVLELGKRRSVATHSLSIEAPELEAAQHIFRGSGHYETGCRPCHGGPGIEQPRVALAMLPAPPDLSIRVKSWAPEELFHIVKHGIKLTGMPAWPSQQRDDEVWAMTAFLLELPELDGAEYRKLVYGDAGIEPAGAALLERLKSAEEPLIATSCVRCHGVEGKGRTPSAVPRLSGQRPAYFVTTLEALAAGERHSGIMGPVAANLSLEQMRELASYYAGRVGKPDAASQPPQDPAAFERGEQIARLGIPSQGVPSCRDCHGPGPEERNPMYPTLVGQYAEYLLLQLELFKAEQRGGSSYAHLMRHVATRLKPEQMRDVAAYYAGLPATGDERGQ